MKPPILYRISSVLLLLFAAGHTLGFRQNNPEWHADSVLALMRSVNFDAQGFTRTYWDFFSAFGLLFTVFVVFAAVLAWLLAGLPCGDSVTRTQHRVGARYLLYGSHSFDLEICLHYSPRFLNPHYNRFDRCGVALTEAKLNSLSVASATT